MSQAHVYVWVILAAVASCPLAAAWGSAPAPSPQPAGGGAASIPIRGLHTFPPSKADLPEALKFIREALPAEGVNTLIVEFNYGFNYRSRAEFADPSALGAEEVRQLADACREKGIELIPQINCLGHQSWAQRTAKLLTKHPEFDETPGKYPENKGIYCRSYCPLHPEVHKVLFDLIDELAKACQARSFHIGMDEVFILADPDCPRCKGKDPADLFAGEVKTLHEHLAKIGCRTWMWGDRFLDGTATGIGKWEASTNGTHGAIDRVPKDIVICDWHYGKAHKTARLFAEKGFQVVECPWRDPAVALAQLADIRALRAGPDRAAGARAAGMVQTTWCGFAPFLRAYQADLAGTPATQPQTQKAAKKAAARNEPAEAARCFRALCKAMREAR